MKPDAPNTVHTSPEKEDRPPRPFLRAAMLGLVRKRTSDEECRWLPEVTTAARTPRPQPDSKESTVTKQTAQVINQNSSGKIST